MKKQCGDKWAKSWHNPKAGYPVFRCVSGGPRFGWVGIVLLVLFLLIVFLL